MSAASLLTLGFSTTGARLPQLIQLLTKLSGLDVAILVVVQLWEETQKSQTVNLPYVRFIWADSVGLSRSRNSLLDEATTEFLWLLDDDVDIIPTDLNTLLGLLPGLANSTAMLRVRVGCSEDHQAYYKPYSDGDRVNKLALLRMNSIELILRREFVLRFGIRFNNRIGLGTEYPGGEEIHFLLDLYEAGGGIALAHDPYVYHSCKAGGRRKKESDAIMEIRGATASRLGLWGPLLILRWSLRYWMRDRRFSVITALLKGYLKGYRAYL